MITAGLFLVLKNPLFLAGFLIHNQLRLSAATLKYPQHW